MEDSKKNKLKEILVLLKYMGFEKIDVRSPNTSPLSNLEKAVAGCKKCRLHETRTNTVFGEGPANADFMIIGEAPGEREDEQGLPFVGAAGRELDIVLELAGIDRKDIYITNVVKCRPPGNRNPDMDEIESCIGYLKRQLEMINPEVIILLGNVALSLVTGTASGITKMRGKKMKYLSYTAIPTFHPVYVIRNPRSRELVAKDLKEAKRCIG